MKNCLKEKWEDFMYWLPYSYVPRDVYNTCKWGLQRMFRGYDDTAYWDLRYYIAEISVPCLEKLINDRCGYPMGLTSDQWDEILKKIHWSMNEILNETNCPYNKDGFDWRNKGDKWKYTLYQKRVQEGLELFGKHFQSLWD